MMSYGFLKIALQLVASDDMQEHKQSLAYDMNTWTAKIHSAYVYFK